jgi:hypothetical protein
MILEEKSEFEKKKKGCREFQKIVLFVFKMDTVCISKTIYLVKI